MIRKYGLTALIVILSLTLVAGLVFWFWWGQSRLDYISKAPDFTLQNVEGQPVSLDGTAGKIRVVEFMFATCPDICPMTTAKLVQIQEKLKNKDLFGTDVQFIAITFNPEQDTADVLKNYARGMKMDMSGWELLRGTPEETQQVLDGFGVYAEKQADGQFAHGTRSLFLIDRKNNIRKIYTMGDEMPTNEVYDDIMNLKNDINLFK